VSEALVALGIVLVIEGALYALFPDLMKRVAAVALETPADRLRTMGAVSAALGVLVVWFVRG